MKNLQTSKLKKSIKCGDIFRVGNHIIACGDARDAEFVRRVIGQNKIKLILCDPPYAVRVVESKAGFSELKVSKKILNDDIESESDYTKFTKDWLAAAVPHLTVKNSVYIFNSDKMLFALRDGMLQADVKFSQLLIWVKNHIVVGRKDYLPAHELIAYGWHGTHDFKKSKDRSVIFYPKPNKSPLHPTQKPVGLLRRLILNITNIGDVVYDSFGGSGSTALAAEQVKRKSILIERDEEYCQVIINRLEKILNLKAEKI
ncbi:MAG: site-specific DNA-methyltransferase [Candidatus Parcubacteria bacterium]|nr:site-specific DNA-methyltransferase [Candidatus Parcubacteria bacterium]